MSKEKLIPELRFPEFKSDGHFQEKPLGYFCNYWNGSGNESGVTEDGQYFLISLNSINIEGNLKSDMKRVSAIDNSLKKGDLVMVLSDVAHGNFLGLTAIIPDDNYVLNQRMAGLGIKDFRKIDPSYLRLFINYSQKYFKKQGQGSSQQNLSKASVIDFPVLVPLQLTEQQKIASCLSSLDELLAAHNDKLDALKDHKKGLMQNLFPQEGDASSGSALPKVRFKEFAGDGEWVEKKLGGICEVITKGTTPQKFSDTGIRFIKIEAFQGNQIIAKKCMFISDDVHNKELKRSILKENDILFAIAGATIGKVNIVKKDILPANTNQALAIVRLKEKENKYFILHILKSHLMQVYIKKSISVGAQPNLNLEQMGSFSFAYPVNPNEQQKIASCLSAVDELINAQADKIEQLQQHKKGLMQGLFPKSITN